MKEVNKFPEIILNIHHFPSHSKREYFYYGKRGKKYTEKEYHKMIRRKETIKEIVQIIIFGLFLLVRGYVFLKYGV